MTVPRGPVAVIHNRYLQPGGEDAAVAAHVALLEARGCRVVRYETNNEALAGLGPLGQATATIWNSKARDDLQRMLTKARPAVAHFHNTFPYLSPSVYAAARSVGVPVVQSLHNYRLICPGALLYRDGKPCTDCVSRRVKWPAAVHGCYRQSLAASAVTAGMLAVGNVNKTWERSVDAYVALTEFARDRFIAGGLPPDRIVVHPNVLATDPGAGAHETGFALFVGRLSPEKGIGTMLDAWRRANFGSRTLLVVGDGPLEGSFDRSIPGVQWLGECANERVITLMQQAAFLVLPSECYEGFPMTLVEAFATGLPVIASNHGAMAELVVHGVNGYHFRPGDASDLSSAMARAFDNPTECRALGDAARRTFMERYTSDQAYDRLMALYGRLAQQVVA